MYLYPCYMGRVTLLVETKPGEYKFPNCGYLSAFVRVVGETCKGREMYVYLRDLVEIGETSEVK